MTDLVDFERAVLCVFELQYAETPEAEERAPLKQQAMAYCEQVKHSEAGWRQNLGLLKSSQRSEAHFYALQTLQELLVLRDGEGGAGLCSLLPEAARAELRVELLLWVQQLSQQQLLPRLASFVLTKLAVVLALLVKADYPERWTSAFDELLMLLKGGVAGIELHLRVFSAIDEEIVSCMASVGSPYCARVPAICLLRRALSTADETKCALSRHSPRALQRKECTTWPSRMRCAAVTVSSRYLTRGFPSSRLFRAKTLNSPTRAWARCSVRKSVLARLSAAAAPFLSLS